MKLSGKSIFWEDAKKRQAESRTRSRPKGLYYNRRPLDRYDISR